MTIDERLDRLAERHEALTQSVELLLASQREMTAGFEKQIAESARFERRIADEHVEFAAEHRRLLTAQVVLTDRLDKFIEVQAKSHAELDRKMQELTEKQSETTGKLNALIAVVDGVVRREPRPPQAS